MATFAKFNAFTEALAEKKHNLGSDALKVLLTNAAPDPATDVVKTDVTEITPGNGYVAGGVAVTVTSSAQTGGIYKLVGTAASVVAAGGSIGPFQYAVLWNDTAANDDLIGFWDYGSAVTLADGETMPLTFSPANTILQLT